MESRPVLYRKWEVGGVLEDGWLGAWRMVDKEEVGRVCWVVFNSVGYDERQVVQLCE